MKVRELMTTDVQKCTPADTLVRPAQLMWERDCGVIPIVDDDGRPLAMITDRDVCMAAYTQGKRLEDIPIASAMSKEVVSCRVDDTVVTAESLMRTHQLRRLPVIDPEGRLAGILSLNDIATHARGRRWSSVTRDELGADAIAGTLSAICSRQAMPHAAE